MPKIYVQQSDGPPEPPNVLISNIRKRGLHGVSVDTLGLGGKTVIWLRIDGLQTTFRSVGRLHHYPIFVGYNEGRRPLFAAAVKVDHVYHFTCVEDGDSVARFKDEVGEERESCTFFVLAEIRSDEAEGQPNTWQPLWPTRSPDYLPASASAEDDDEHLVALLNSYRDDDDLNYWDGM